MGTAEDEGVNPLFLQGRNIAPHNALRLPIVPADPTVFHQRHQQRAGSGNHPPAVPLQPPLKRLGTEGGAGTDDANDAAAVARRAASAAASTTPQAGTGRAAST